ncbi:MAG: DUF1800 family protein [Alphaproteobacteria bacterium]
MGGEGTLLDRRAARHLLRRSGFGASDRVVDRWLRVGATRGQAADELVAFTPAGFKPGGRSLAEMHDNWVKYLMKARSGLNEKLVLFWHDHFATSFGKVGVEALVARQNQLLRKSCRGNMVALVKAVNRDPAMMIFLDTIKNSKVEPNENYGREMLELFTLGTTDQDGRRNYSDQQDPAAIARAFSGWNIDRNTGEPLFRDSRHDTQAAYPERGPKVLFAADAANPGGYGGYGPGGASFADGGEGPQEIDRVTEIVFGHRDGDGVPTVARRTARRLFEFFAYGSYRDAAGEDHGGFAAPEPGSEERAAIDDVIERSGFATRWEIGPLVREILVHDAFYASLDDPARKSVKWPVDLVVSTLKTLGLKLVGREARVPGLGDKSVYTHLLNMGQVVLNPPSVFGWEWESAWIGSQSLLARFSFARDVYTARSTGGLRPDKLVSPALTQPGDVVDAVTDLLGVREDLSTAERAALVAYLGTGPVDLLDPVTVDKKLRGLFGLVLQSPAYQLH